MNSVILSIQFRSDLMENNVYTVKVLNVSDTELNSYYIHV